MKSLTIIAPLCLAALATTGCRMTRVCNSDGGMEVSQAEGAKSCNVRISDICFEEGVAVEQSRLCRNAAGFLVATVTLRNTMVDNDDFDRRDPFTIQYRAKWFDANGIEVLPDSTSWVREKMKGGLTTTLTFAAPSREAVRFVLQLSHAR